MDGLGGYGIRELIGLGFILLMCFLFVANVVYDLYYWKKYKKKNKL